MHRLWKRAAILGGAGVLTGLGIIGWLQLRPDNETVANSNGGSIALTTSTPEPTPDPLELRVAEANSGSVQGLSHSEAGTAPAATPAPAPGPADFRQYEKYRDEQNALMGDMVTGQGPEVKMGSTVSVAYRGWLTDGKLFDESYSRGVLYSFTVGERRVIAGWEQGLLGMKVGGKRRLIVPPAAGYGSEAHDPIPPNSVLVFDIELLGVK
jgi:FKBP-type peptidyl-prolyl cis-trans isomerase